MSPPESRPTTDWVVHVGFIGALLLGLSVIRGDYDRLTLFAFVLMVGSMLVRWWLGRRER